MASENLEVVMRSYEMSSEGDVDAWLALIDPDAELHELAEIPDTAVYRGHDEIRGWAERAQELVEEWRWTPEEVIRDAGGLVVIRVRMTAKGRGSGVPVEQVVFHVIEVRAGRIASFRGFLNRDQAIAAAGALEQPE